MEQSYSQQLNASLQQVVSLNSELPKANLYRSADNNNIAELNDKISALKDERNIQRARDNSNLKPTKTSDSVDARSRRTRSVPDKFSALQQSTEKRQLAYESWKTRIQ